MKQAGGIHWGEGNGVTELLERTCSIHGGSSRARWATRMGRSNRPSRFERISGSQASARSATACMNPLGRVDGFDDDEAQSECDEGSEVPVRFLATERNALEALELADEVFDAGAGAIERLREEGRPVLGR